MSSTQSNELNKQLTGLLTQAKEPGSKEHKDLGTFLDNHPELWSNLANLDQLALSEILRLEKIPAFQEVFRVKVTSLKDDLGWGDSSPLIKLVINAVALSFLRWIISEQKYANVVTSQSYSLNSAKFWSKQAIDSQKIYLRSCESLARVKRLSKRCPELSNDFTDKKSLLM